MKDQPDAWQCDIGCRFIGGELEDGLGLAADDQRQPHEHSYMNTDMNTDMNTSRQRQREHTTK